MPRLVDHEERRVAIIETTWNIIATKGIENATMRDIAAECGYATPGIISHYFVNKRELLVAAYELICQRTNERIDEVLKSRRGLEALLAMCLEIIPAEELTVLEAKVAVAFWQLAQTDDQLRRIGASALDRWNRQIFQCLTEAKSAAEVPSSLSVDNSCSELINVMVGLHITSMLEPSNLSASNQRHLIKRIIDNWKTRDCADSATSAT